MKTIQSIAKASILALVAGLSTACQGVETDTQSQLTSDIRDIPANNCEIFIDKALMTERWDDSGSRYQNLQILVKLLPERLDGPVSRVVFSREKSSSHSYGGTNYGWSDDELSAFGGAVDYFDKTMLLEYWNERSWKRESFTFEGALYVETARGTRYWANAGQVQGFQSVRGNWVLNMDNLKGGALPELPVLGQAPSIESLAKTSQMGALGKFLNPQGCE